MHDKTEQTEELTDSLADGIAAVMAASERLETGVDGEEMADLFLGELNRLWTEGSLEQAA
jgi:hypothetical protein